MGRQGRPEQGQPPMTEEVGLHIDDKGNGRHDRTSEGVSHIPHTEPAGKPWANPA
jgi:hypothetical protein